MLLSAQIHSFRSCSNVDLGSVERLVVLVGRNGVGKTNVLLALEWAARIATARTGELDSYLQTPGSVVLTIKLDDRVYEYSVQVDMRHDDKNSPSFHLIESLRARLSNDTFDDVFTRDSGSVSYGVDGKRLNIASMSPAASAIISIAPSDPATAVIIKVVDYLARVRYLALDTAAREPVQPFVSEAIYNAWVTDSSTSKSDGAKLQLQLLHLSLTKPAAFQNFLDLVGPNGLSLIDSFKIESFIVPRPSKEDPTASIKYYLFQWAPKLNGKTSIYEFDSLSYGTRRLLRLFVALFFFDNSLLLIEQPEDGIHAGLLHRVMPTLRSYCDQRQVVVATHSTAVLNECEPEEIRLVDMTDGRTSVRTLTSDEISAARDYLSEDGPLASFLEIVQG